MIHTIHEEHGLTDSTECIHILEDDLCTDQTSTSIANHSSSDLVHLKRDAALKW